MNPVFFAPTDIQPGDLSEELKMRLKASRHLIVICSPESAKSEWVGKEISYFHSLGRLCDIHFFIVRGVPHSKDFEQECFNQVISELNFPEILGANINEKIYRLPYLNVERAYIQLITKLLGIEFDVLWNRHRKFLCYKVALCTMTALWAFFAVIFAYKISQPIDISMSLHVITPPNNNLPPMNNASLSLVLSNEKKDTTFCAEDEIIKFSNIPAHMLGEEVTVHFSCDNFETLDTTFLLSRDVVLNISRDTSAFGHVHFTLYDKNHRPLPNIELALNGIQTTSDNEGKVDLIIPLDKQQTVYHLASSSVSLRDTLKDAKCGNFDAIFVE